MKIEQQPREFQPITITLETDGDVRAVERLMIAARACYDTDTATYAVADYIINTLSEPSKQPNTK